MIHFACSHCGTKFKVKDELEGRSGACPSCKQAVVVPRQVAHSPPPTGEVSGQASSLHRAGVDVTVSLKTRNQVAASKSGILSLLAGKSRSENRYVIEQEIARGGMGAVVRAVDCDIRREVAIKFMLDETDDKKKARFVEEAQITGQLEHPNIVPIHELGLDAQKRLFFAMKMVNGRSLAEILEALRKNPQAEEKLWSLGRLLNILVNVCHALSYAHSRGVIHRDLKPANIMVGDFGEVYVMDWGLAKVLGDASVAGEQPPPGRSLASPSLRSSGEIPESSNRSLQLTTNRELDGELTQDGAIIGTPLYMPPEQARGEVRLLDPRSDLYSLGAILYEFLTLLPPVEKDGGHTAILLRVVDGKILPPAERTPQRARQGKIPAELAAIAMKALALEPPNRYPNCEALRRDIELYQEGRSVSAKQDSAVELLQKLVKRNRAASIAIGTAALILLAFGGIFLKLNRDARLVAEAHQRTAEQQRGVAQEQKKTADEQRMLAVSAQAATEQAYSEFQREQNAKEQVIRESIPAMLRAAQQLINEGRIEQAEQQVALALTYVPNDPDARLLNGQILLSQQAWEASRAEIEFHLKQRPESAIAQALWKELRDPAPPDNTRMFALAELLKQQQLTGLAIPLMAIVQREVANRRPLVDLYNQHVEANWPNQKNKVKLELDGRITLNFGRVKEVTDISPLQGMLLDELKIGDGPLVADITPLTGMPLRKLEIIACPIVSIEALRGMPLETLSLPRCQEIRDISPLRGMRLKKLNLSDCRQLKTLNDLAQMPLTDLDISKLPIVSLEPLRGMKLESLYLNSCSFVKDLSPLTGMPLRYLAATALGSKIEDVSPLKGMPLNVLELSGQFSDLEPLRGMPLKELQLVCNATDLAAIRGMPLQRLHLKWTSVHDLTPLRGMELQFIQFESHKITSGIEILREMKSLTSITHLAPARSSEYPPDEFWRRYDAGEFNLPPK